MLLLTWKSYLDNLQLWEALALQSLEKQKDLKGRVAERKKKKSSICWFTPKTGLIIQVGPGRRQEPGTLSWSPTLAAGAQTLGRLLLISSRPFTRSTVWNETDWMELSPIWCCCQLYLQGYSAGSYRLFVCYFCFSLFFEFDNSHFIFFCWTTIISPSSYISALCS